MQKLTDHANKLIVKAMSNRQEKIVDLLKDISTKCDHLKIFTGDSIPLEITCKNCQTTIIFTEIMKKKDFLICEFCGEEIELPK